MEWIRSLGPGNEVWSAQELADNTVADRALVARAVEILGTDAAGWAVQTVHRAEARIQARKAGDGPPVSAPIGRDRQAGEEAILHLLIALATDSRAELYADVSPGIVNIFRAESRHGVPIDRVLNRIWGVHSLVRDEVLARLRHIVDEEQRGQVLDDVSMAMLDHTNCFVRQLVAAYDDEERATRVRRPEVQLRVLTAVAEGAQPPARDGSFVEGSWDGGHLFAVGWADRDEHIIDDEGDLARYARASAERLSADSFLTLERNGQILLWWNFVREMPSNVISSLPQPPSWLRLAVGPLGKGLAGFRASWRGAHLTAQVGRQATERTTWHYDDVGHLALLLENRSSAAWFVQNELGPLAQPGARARDIRDTVRLFLLNGNSRVAAANALHIAPTTVAYRVRQAYEMLGRPVGERTQQILLALQLIHIVPDLVEPSAL
ncbi:hypothetical protein GCM10027416_28230 [Okibacterium endophyticum]